MAASKTATAPGLDEIRDALIAARDGDFSRRLPRRRRGELGEIAAAYNELVARNAAMEKELARMRRVIGREGRMDQRASLGSAGGGWSASVESLNALIDDLVRPTSEVASVLDAVADGDLDRKMALTIEGQPVKGEFLRIGTTVNTMVGQLSSFADEVTRVAREVGTEGKLGGQAEVKGVSGTWRALTESVNDMASNLTDQVRNISQVAQAVARGDLSQKITVEAKGEVAELADTINEMTDTLAIFAEQVTSVAREVGTDGLLGGQAAVPNVAGTWKDLTDSVNLMASNLTSQVRNIAQVMTAVAGGDLSQKITVDVKGEILELKETTNTMLEQLSSFADEVTRVAREVGTEGKLGGQAAVPNVAGTWKDLTDSVNLMASNLTSQVRDIAQVTTAVAEGDLSQKVMVDVKGEILELKETVNTMVDQLSSFADEVTRVAREVGTEGKLGGQAEVKGVSGTWRDLTESVNFMASNLTDQVRSIAQVSTAVAEGDLSQKITVEAMGEVAALAETINKMVDRLRSFAAEVTRVAREVGTEGKLGGQAEVEDVSGTWRGLTENVNSMASNLTDQVRNIAEVTTAVARGDLSKKITVDAQGEILELKETVNTMVDQLSSFADEVTRVAREVGTEGKLGGQAQVEGVSGTWRGLTENVNQLASNLTTQVRSIAEVSTAVTQGDLTRSISVEASGEVADLKDNINQMIANLRETTRRNEEQDWLKTNLARISSLMQGQRDLETVSQLIMSELSPAVSAQHGAFFLADHEEEDKEYELRLLASYGYTRRKSVANRFKPGEALVGQAALEKKPILITDPPEDYIHISSGLGEGTPRNIIVIPVTFEGQVLAVIELASFREFGEINLQFLDQLTETIGVVLSTIIANVRTEQLLEQSQSQSTELQEKAQQLELQNRDIEIKNREIETARSSLEEKAEQLALSSKYKSEFLANMSHELRTPLNSLLILSKVLATNELGNLSEKQVDAARTIHNAGSDLLTLINDILDLSKVEAGKMDVHPGRTVLAGVRDYVERSFRPVAEEKGLDFAVEVEPGAPVEIETDEQRLQQVLTNLLSNAFKFTNTGQVRLRMSGADGGGVAFAVEDTGIGIPPDKLKLIFEAFQQAEGSISRRFGGTGLGLSISREIARLLGGEIEARSTEGVGSTFTLILPPEAPQVDRPEPQIAPPVERARQHLRIDSVALPEQLRDDRADVMMGDRVVLVIAEDRALARNALEAAHGHGFKCLLALRGDAGLALVHEFMPKAIVLSSNLPHVEGRALLDHLKRHPETRHIPVYMLGEPDIDREVRIAGALGVIPPGSSLGTVFDELAARLDRRTGSVLLVEGDGPQRAELTDLIGGADVEIVPASSREEALERLDERGWDCVVIDVALDDVFAVLERVKRAKRFRGLPVIVDAREELGERERARLGRYAETIVLKEAGSPERLLEEASLYLHTPAARLPAEKRQMLEELHAGDAVFDGKKVLIVDDDVRNVFALASVFERRGMNVVFAENGREGVDALKHHPDVALVLMDIMMPEMDGYEATRTMREMPEFERLPIVALTAKAMKGDREKSIASGASDYITKPVDVDRLLSLMRVWLLR